MSRTTEIMRKLSDSGQKEQTSIDTRKIESPLWGRFKKVHDTIFEVLLNPTSGVKKNLETFNWSGEDAGISDHNGKILGTANEIFLNLDIKGTTILNQSKIKLDENKNLRIVYEDERHMTIKGEFRSKDGKRGFVQIDTFNELHSAAYWLEGVGGHYHLEQITDEEGITYDAEHFPREERDVIRIPSTHSYFSTKSLLPTPTDSYSHILIDKN